MSTGDRRSSTEPASGGESGCSAAVEAGTPEGLGLSSGLKGRCAHCTEVVAREPVCLDLGADRLKKNFPEN